MGEIADDYIEGRCCTGCMCYFKNEHGYPVLCNDCWKEATKQERKQYQKAIYDEI